MAPAIGNKFWKARSKSGRDLIFKEPKNLWDAAVEYFEWVDANPLQEEKAIVVSGEIVAHNTNKMRAMSIGALCVFLKVSRKTWDTYSTRDDFLLVTEEIAGIIYDQKFTGASAGLLNANIIARELSLKEQTDITSGGKQVKNDWHIHPVSAKNDKN